MRRIIVWLMSSLDGYISGTGPEGDPANLDWIFPGVAESQPYAEDLVGKVDTILLGRVTYDGLSQFWPFQEGEFADKMNKTPKIVFSTTLKEVQWGSYDTIRLIGKDAAKEMKAIKQQPGGDMIMPASSKLVQSFANAGLIDEYRIVIHPIILGSGKRLFDHIEARHPLKLVDTKRFDGGAVLLHYMVA
jgi:dihydrofolate reductase